MRQPMRRKTILSIGGVYVLLATFVLVAQDNKASSFNSFRDQVWQVCQLDGAPGDCGATDARLPGHAEGDGRAAAPGVEGEIVSGIVQTARAKKFKKNCLIMFSSPGCSACIKMYPVVEKLEAQGYAVYILDYTEYGALAKKWSVRLLPTIFIREGGKEVKKFVGVIPEERIKKYLKKNTPPDYNII